MGAPLQGCAVTLMLLILVYSSAARARVAEPCGLEEPVVKNRSAVTIP